MMVEQKLVNEIERVHVIHVGDTLTPLGVELKPAKSETPRDLTGLTVEFYMLDADGDDKVVQSATGVTVDADPTTGKVTKAFVAADVDTAGDYYGYFVVIDGAAKDTYPVDSKRLLVQVQADL